MDEIGLVEVRLMIMAFEGEIDKTLWSWIFTSIVMACTLWWNSIEAFLMIRCRYDEAIKCLNYVKMWDYV